jgi:hypothetical protein
MPILIAVVNESSLVKNEEVDIMCQAIQIQIDSQFAPAWNQKSIPVKFYTNAAEIPEYAWTIHVIDNDKQINQVLGYHEELSDKIIGYVICQPILSNGGVVLEYDPANESQYTVSATLSHEILETIGNCYTNCWYDTGTTLICAEVADPVEQIGYGIMIGNINVSVSDFILSSFFNPNATLATNGPFNYLNTLTAPFTMLAGGYWIQRIGDVESQVFGESMPQWRRDVKITQYLRSSRLIT